MELKKVAMILGVVCIVLTFAISVQLKTIKEVSKTAASSFSNNELREEVLKWKERYDRMYEELQLEEKKLDIVRKEATENDDTSASVREQLKIANRLLGYTELTGKGVIIVLDDNKLQSVDGISTGKITDYMVHDEDIVSMINEINNAGVDAIAVNNQRIVSTSGIICSGNVIRINGQRVSAPYEIKVIGSPERIIGTIETLGSYLGVLQDVGLVKSVTKSNSITIPKYEGSISIEHLQTVKK